MNYGKRIIHRLDRNHEVYLDYTGAGLYAESQVKKHQQLLLDNVFGNPHSTNPTSLASTELMESTREAILKFFNASPRSMWSFLLPMPVVRSNWWARLIHLEKVVQLLADL